MKVEVSARHVHLCQKDVEKLFGKNFELKPIKQLSQPTEFACKETVILENKGKKIENVRVLGPVRKNSQVELATTDCYKIKVKPVLRLSGDIKGTPSITIKGPKGKINLKQGVIVAKRHLHCSDKEARKLRLRNKQKANIKVSGKRSVTFNNVIVRIKPEFRLSLHLDTDEGNAAGITQKTSGKLV